MSDRLLIGLGRVAGIGGVALGVVLLVFQEIISEKFFPKLSQDQSFAIIQSLMTFTFGIAAVGIVAWIIGKSPAPVTDPQLKSLLLLILAVLVLAAMPYIRSRNYDSCDGATARASDMLSKITNPTISEFVEVCYSRANLRVDDAVHERVKNGLGQWRDQSKSGPAFNYSTLKSELAGLVKTKNFDKQGLHPELLRELEPRENRVAECLYQQVEALLGPVPDCKN